MNIYESPFVLSSRKSALSGEACWRRAPRIAACFSPYRAAMIKPELAFHAVEAVINDTLHLRRFYGARARSRSDRWLLFPSLSLYLSLSLSLTLRERRETFSRLFILTGSISRDIRYAGTVTRVILLRVVAADTPGFFAEARDERSVAAGTSVIGGRLYRTG